MSKVDTPDDEERRELVKTLVDFRVKQGLTQQDVAMRMGVTQGTVSDFEHGTDPRISSYFRYARAVGLQPKMNLQ